MIATRAWRGSTAWSPRTEALAQRMLSPLTGLSGGVGFVIPSQREPRVAVAGGEMTALEVLHDRGASRPGAYHVGGTGLSREEAILKALGETAERYSHITALRAGGRAVVVRSLAEMEASGEDFVCVLGLEYYSADQLARPGFPFGRVDRDTPFGWIRVALLPSMQPAWIPAQEAVIGYSLHPGEPRFTGAVSTGTAAHTSTARALRNALLELVQIDATMGHWYGTSRAFRIGRGPRTESVDRIVDRAVPAGGPSIEFFWLPSPDLPGFAIACLVASDELPRLGIGLGCDLRLPRAMYSAFLEGVAVAQLAKVLLFRAGVEGPPPDHGGLYDLDTNVAHYAREGRAAVASRFDDGAIVDPEDMPADVRLGPAADLRHLVSAFGSSGKKLTLLDLTTPDLTELGFRSLRVWSPDTLPLCLPDAPAPLHPRYAAYGGFGDGTFHPYP